MEASIGSDFLVDIPGLGKHRSTALVMLSPVLGSWRCAIVAYCRHTYDESVFYAV